MLSSWTLLMFLWSNGNSFVDVALCVNQQQRECYTWVYIVALVLHLLASPLCHLTALNKVMLIAHERVSDSWSGSWMRVISVAIDIACGVMSVERPWLIEGCCWKNRLWNRNTKCRKLLSQKQSIGNALCLFASAVFPHHFNIHNKW